MPLQGRGLTRKEKSVGGINQTFFGGGSFLERSAACEEDAAQTGGGNRDALSAALDIAKNGKKAKVIKFP